MNNKALPQDSLARNLQHLMDRAQENPRMLAERLRGAVSQRTIANILAKEKIPRIDTVDEIAGAYGLSGWHLISPTLIDDLDQSPTIRALLSNYAKASEEGRRIIDQIAEREASYSSR